MVSEYNILMILDKNNLLVEATDKNPLVIQSQNQLDEKRPNISFKRLNIYTNKLKMKLNKYDDFKQKSDLMIGVIPLREAELSNLEKDLLLVNNLYSYLSQKKEEALINLSSLEPNIKLINEVDYTVISKTSSKKTFSMFLFAGFILPIGFSLSLFFFRAFYVDVEYLKQDCKVKFKKSHIVEPRKIEKPDDIRPGTKKGKLDRRPIWIVEIQMPKKLIADIYTGYIEAAYIDPTQTPNVPERCRCSACGCGSLLIAPEEAAVQNDTTN